VQPIASFAGSTKIEVPWANRQELNNSRNSKGPKKLASSNQVTFNTLGSLK